MRTKWTTKGNRDVCSCSCDQGLHQYLAEYLNERSLVQARWGAPRPLCFSGRFLVFNVENDCSTGTTVTGIHATFFIAVNIDGKMWAPQKFRLSIKLWGCSSWLFSSQNLFHICSVALNTFTKAVEKSSVYLTRSVLHIDPASVLSFVMRCGSKALKLHNTLRCLRNQSWSSCIRKSRKGVYVDSR